MTDVVVHNELKKAEKLISDLSQALAVVRSELGAARQEISDVRNVAAGSVIKSVQRGMILCSRLSSKGKEDSAVYWDVALANVNPLKSTIIMLGFDLNEMNGLSIRLLNGSTLRVRSQSEIYPPVNISYEVVEYR